MKLPLTSFYKNHSRWEKKLLTISSKGRSKIFQGGRVGDVELEEVIFETIEM
jgi:hypothetical protein